MSYVIHGATGAQGAPVVAALVAAGKPVTALTRKTDAVIEGARVMAADLSSSEQLVSAYRGADGVFVHLPMGDKGDVRKYVHNILSALREARPGRVVFSTSGPVVDLPSSVLQQPADSPVAAMVAGLEDSGLSWTVLTPRLFLENLLLPPIGAVVREQGVLRFPLRADFPVSWVSHLDVADAAAAALLDHPEVTGLVGVGQVPAITGADLAEAFGGRLGRDVTYQAIAPEKFGEMLAPLIGPGPAAGVAGLYRLLATVPDFAIAPERSAQKLLGIAPRSAGQWLADTGL
ncbi:NmrA family NAD(P)-binding protein [Streptomyces sp. NPDC048291]|uniref:NmrA family NAD(P)-binding protein n=1 Tax=Streptomyces sp. NPDC048291 TaxID=3365530 RepID=UPI0037246540